MSRLTLSWSRLMDILKEDMPIDDWFISLDTGLFIRNDFKEIAHTKIKEILDEIEKFEGNKYFPQNAKVTEFIRKFSTTFRKAGVYGDATYFSALGMATLIGTESSVPHTEGFYGYPGKPYRDHVVHIIVVWLIGKFLLENDSQLMTKLVEAIRISKVWGKMNKINKFGVKDAQLSDETMKDIILKAWLVSGLCHDMGYIEQVKSWVDPLRLDDTALKYSEKGDELSTTGRIKKRLNKTIESLTDNEELRKELKKIFEPRVKQKGDNNPKFLNEGDKYYDHGQIAATLLLEYYNNKDHLKGIPTHKHIVILSSIFLAGVTIFDHDLLASLCIDKSDMYDEDDKKLDEDDLAKSKMEINEIVEDYWDRNPLSVFLTILDLLSEGLRLSWQLYHYNDIVHCPREISDHEREMVSRNFIGIPTIKITQESQNQEYLISYKFNQERYDYPNLNNGKEVKSWSAWKAIYDESTIPEKYDKRRDDYIANGYSDDWNSLTQKERQINRLWKQIFPDQGHIILNHI